MEDKQTNTKEEKMATKGQNDSQNKFIIDYSRLMITSLGDIFRLSDENLAGLEYENKGYLKEVYKDNKDKRNALKGFTRGLLIAKQSKLKDLIDELTQKLNKYVEDGKLDKFEVNDLNFLLQCIYDRYIDYLAQSEFVFITKS